MVRRRFLTCLTILSLLLCLAMIALWVRGNWRADTLGYSSSRQAFGLASEYHTVAAFWNSDYPNPTGFHFLFSYHVSPRPELWEGFGWKFLTEPDPVRTKQFRVVFAPHWFFALLFALLPAWWLRAHL